MQPPWKFCKLSEIKNELRTLVWGFYTPEVFFFHSIATNNKKIGSNLQISLEIELQKCKIFVNSLDCPKFVPLWILGHFWKKLIDQLRGNWSLELNFLDKKLAIQGFEDNIQTSYLVELSFIFWKTNLIFFCMYTLRHT